MGAALIIIAILLFLIVLFLFAAIKVAREYERGIVFRLGRLLASPEGPGRFILLAVLARHVLDERLSEREKINSILQGIIDESTAPWGIKVSIVEVKDVEIPSGMQRAMARQAEAER